jgi:hypothetical protein
MKNIRVKTITGNTFDFSFNLPLELHKEIPAILDVYQVNGDLLCNILSQEFTRGQFATGNPKLTVVFEDLYKSKYKFTIEQIYSFKDKKHYYDVRLDESCEWFKVGALQVKI